MLLVLRSIFICFELLLTTALQVNQLPLLPSQRESHLHEENLNGRADRNVLQDHTPSTAGPYNPVGVGVWKYLLRFPSAEFARLAPTHTSKLRIEVSLTGGYRKVNISSWQSFCDRPSTMMITIHTVWSGCLVTRARLKWSNNTENSDLMRWEVLTITIWHAYWLEHSLMQMDIVTSSRRIMFIMTNC